MNVSTTKTLHFKSVSSKALMSITYRDKRNHECKGNDDTYLECSVRSCLKVNRMINALIYYSTIEPIKFEKHRDKFTKYYKETYPEILHDYIHIMDKHYNDIDKISDLMIQDFKLMAKCNIRNCKLLGRHYRDRDQPLLKELKNNKHPSIKECSHQQIIEILQSNEIFNDKTINPWKNKIIEYIKQNEINGKTLLDDITRKQFAENVIKHCDDNKKVRGAATKVHDKLKATENVDVIYQNIDQDLIFHVNLLDKMHCFFYHLYDIGARVKLSDLIIADAGDMNESEVFDTSFSNICEILQQKRANMSSIKGLHNLYRKQEKFIIELQKNDSG